MSVQPAPSTARHDGTCTSPIKAATTLHRVEIRPRHPRFDPIAAWVVREAQHRDLPIESACVSKVYLIEASLDATDINRVGENILADPITQTLTVGCTQLPESVAGQVTTVEVHYKPGVMDPVAQSTREVILEMFPQLDPKTLEVRTGQRYDLTWSPNLDSDSNLPPPTIADHSTILNDRILSTQALAESALANPVVQNIFLEPYHPAQFVHGDVYQLHLVHVPIRDLDDQALMKLSRDGHLFLNLDEMKAIQAYYCNLPEDREPTDIELETLAQTWSEHCVHKTLKATIRYQQTDENQTPHPHDWANRPGHTLHTDGSITIENLLKSTIAAATTKLMEQEQQGLKKKNQKNCHQPEATTVTNCDATTSGDSMTPEGWCISVFNDNAGIVGFDDDHAVCIKVETHNHPSAIEPYGGAATGIGGCIRDIMGTGLAAKPIANTNVFCVAADPSSNHVQSLDCGSETSDFRLDLPKGVIPPRQILQQVVAGVRDYGNRMGIPTVNGAVWFHDDYVANPLVFAGCVGLIPRDKCFGEAHDGDRIVVLGGRTGRDGIHGATFSSAELTDTHADEFAHAVQIGNAITQKKTLDVILQARDHVDGCLYHAITDCGAGGFSSAVGEMGQEIGAVVTLETAPLKYPGLSYTEIWISEAQERMVLAVPPDHIDKLQALCDAEDVEMCDLGQFGLYDKTDQPLLELMYKGCQVGQLSMSLLHDGLPTTTRQAVYPSPLDRSALDKPPRLADSSTPSQNASHITNTLYQLLSHPNIASKHWIVRQYDHEVQGGSVVKPLTGPWQDGPSDASVIRPKLTSRRGVAIGCGLQPGLGEKAIGGQGDSYWMTLAAIDEAVRNVVCVGTDTQRIAILDNFCWPSCDDPAMLGSLVRAAEACHDGALAYHTPFVSGKDSLSNQFTTEQGQLITVPVTLLITALGIVPDVKRCLTMDAKSEGNILIVVGATGSSMGGSHYMTVTGDIDHDVNVPRVDLKLGPKTASIVANLIAQGLAVAAHDVSDGGLLVAAVEMAFAGRLGLDLDLTHLPTYDGTDLDATSACFSETPSRYLLEIRPDDLPSVQGLLHEAGVVYGHIGVLTGHQQLTCRFQGAARLVNEPIDRLLAAWQNPLDW